MVSLLGGALGALIQTNIKRFIAFSVLFNNGFIFIAILSNSFHSISILITFLIFYSITLLSIFLIINSITNNSLRNLKDLILLKSNSLLSLFFIFNFFCLAGIPPFSIFFIKFFLLMEVFNKGYVMIVIIAILINVFVSYYYLRVSKIIYFSTINVNSGDVITYNELKFVNNKKLNKMISILLSFITVLNFIFVIFPKLFYLFILTFFI